MTDCVALTASRRNIMPVVSPSPSISAIADRVDEQIIHAMQISPRASFRLIGEVLDLPEKTVARHYRRLRRDGLLRVTLLVAPSPTGKTTHTVRVRTGRETSGTLAELLARHEDISWVSVHGGGRDVQFSLRAQDPLDEKLRTLIPACFPVRDITTATVLHRFIGSSPDDWTNWSDALTAEQTVALAADTGPGAPTGDGTPREHVLPLTARDRRMLDQLAADGRTPYARLARTLDTTAGAVTRRVEALIGAGLAYFDIDIAPAVTGRQPASVRLRTTPARLDAVGRALAALPDVPYAAAVSGADNIFATVMASGPADLYRLVTEELAGIPGISGYSVSPVDRLVKSAGARISGDRLAPPEAPR
jgi:DNA-binding Lrp family transcriptional regulator